MIAGRALAIQGGSSCGRCRSRDWVATREVRCPVGWMSAGSAAPVELRQHRSWLLMIDDAHQSLKSTPVHTLPSECGNSDAYCHQASGLKQILYLPYTAQAYEIAPDQPKWTDLDEFGALLYTSFLLREEPVNGTRSLIVNCDSPRRGRIAHSTY